MDTPTQLLDIFGKLVVEYVRDDVISGIDQALEDKRRDIYSQYLYSLAQGLPPEALLFIHKLLPKIVDATIATFLQLIDTDEQLQLSIRNEASIYINLLELTDSLEGEYLSTEGWVATFSQERPDPIRSAADELFELRRKRDKE
jgi:hypothetical protein